MIDDLETLGLVFAAVTAIGVGAILADKKLAKQCAKGEAAEQGRAT